MQITYAMRAFYLEILSPYLLWMRYHPIAVKIYF